MDKKSGRAHRTVNCRRALRPSLGPFARGKHNHTKFDYDSRGGSHNQQFLGPVVLNPCKTYHLLLPHNLQHKYTTLSLIDVLLPFYSRAPNRPVLLHARPSSSVVECVPGSAGGAATRTRPNQFIHCQFTTKLQGN